MTHVDTTTRPATPAGAPAPRVLRLPSRRHHVVTSLAVIGVCSMGLAASANAVLSKPPSLATQLKSGESLVLLSSLTPSSATNGWGPYERNTNNGDKPAGDGTTQTLQGYTYRSGLGTHAPAAVQYKLDGQYTRFESSVGVDDSEGAKGSVDFEVWVDGVRKTSSGTLTGASGTKKLAVSVAGAKTLQLVVTGTGDGYEHDHANWANALLVRSTKTSSSVTVAPSTSSTTSTSPTSTATSSTSTSPTSTATSSTSTSSTSTSPSSTSSSPSPTSTTTAPAPVTTGYPNASTTGAKGTLTVRSGNLEITQDGTVLQNVEIRGQLTIRAKNVVMRNVKVVSNGNFWTVINYGANLLIEDSTLVGDAAAQASLGNTAGGYFTGRRINAYGAGDGVRMTSNSAMYDSYIHDLAKGADIHNDAVDLWSAVNGKLIHNTIENPHGQTSVVMISEYGSNTNTGVEVRNNFLAGGGFTVYGGAPDTAKGHVVADNVFSTKFFPESGYYGARAYWSSTGNTWSNNTWADGPNKGKPVS